MRSVKGIYDGEKVQLLEKIDADRPCKVIVTFIEDETGTEFRNYPADEGAFPFWTAKEEDIYQDYLKKKPE